MWAHSGRHADVAERVEEAFVGAGKATFSVVSGSIHPLHALPPVINLVPAAIQAPQFVADQNGYSVPGAA
jgi:hypothetical protein